MRSLVRIWNTVCALDMRLSTVTVASLYCIALAVSIFPIALCSNSRPLPPPRVLLTNVGAGVSMTLAAPPPLFPATR